MLNRQNPMIKDKAPQFVSTATAAQMLGLSTTLIQSLVDKNELEGWKTTGGHRRISMQSIHDYQSNGRMLTQSSVPTRPPTVLVAIETPRMIEMLERISEGWGFPGRLIFISSVTEALLIVGSERPDLLVVEMGMSRSQQEKTLYALENFNTKGRPLSMVLITQITDLRLKDSNSGKRIQIAPGPLSEVWLHAFLTGTMATSRN